MKLLSSAILMAVKDIRHNRRIVVLVLISLAFSFVNIIFVSSIIKGFGVTFRKQVTNMYGQIIIEPKEGSSFINNAGKVEKRIRAVDGVAGVTSRLISSGSVKYKNKERGALIQGVSLKKENEVSILPSSVIKGDYLKSNDKNQILVGKDLADFLKKGDDDEKFVKVGNKIMVTYPNGKVKKYTIKGVVDVKSFASNSYLYVIKKDLTQVLGTRDKASEVYVKLDNDLQEVSEVRKRIKDLNFDAVVDTWNERAGYVKDTMKGIEALRYILSLIGLIITAIVIAVIIYINTQNKRRQIGILKAIGGQARLVLTIFLIQSFIYAILGIVLGGIIFSGINYYLIKNPLIMPFGELVPDVQRTLVINYIVIFILTSFFSALYPAWRSSKENIVKVIWGQ